nr:sterol desaturase family protein [Pseudopedobacter sp.]
MKKLFANDTGKGRVSSNNIIEILSKTSIPLTIITYSCIWGALMALNYFKTATSLLNSIIVYSLAIFAWTLFEYLMHRYVFHFINESSWSQRFHYAIHGVHHDYPRDEERLFMPPIPGLILIIILAGFFSFMGSLTFIWMAGFLNGWAIYVSLHYLVHAYPPQKPLKFLWRHHAKHHYKNGNKAFGVSSPFWDMVFGTMPEK